MLQHLQIGFYIFNLRFQKFEPVTCKQNISIAVDFEHVSVKIIPPQSANLAG